MGVVVTMALLDSLPAQSLTAQPLLWLSQPWCCAALWRHTCTICKHSSSAARVRATSPGGESGTKRQRQAQLQGAAHQPGHHKGPAHGAAVVQQERNHSLLQQTYERSITSTATDTMPAWKQATCVCTCTTAVLRKHLPLMPDCASRLMISAPPNTATTTHPQPSADLLLNTQVPNLQHTHGPGWVDQRVSYSCHRPQKAGCRNITFIMLLFCWTAAVLRCVPPTLRLVLWHSDNERVARGRKQLRQLQQQRHSHLGG